MSCTPEAIFRTRGPAETRRVARLLASLLTGTEVLHLQGGLGAGKTLFTQGLAAGLGSDPNNPPVSPTFTLVNEYPGRLPLTHVDLYRLENPEEVRALGLEEYLERTVTVIEWAERLPADLAFRTLTVRINPGESPRQRILEIVPGDDPGDIVGRLAALAARSCPALLAGR